MGGMDCSLIWRVASTLLSQKAQWYLLSPCRCSALSSRACSHISHILSLETPAGISRTSQLLPSCKTSKLVK